VDVVDKDILKNATDAGAIYVNYGFESGSDQVLQKNRKGFKSEDIIRAIKDTRAAGIRFIHGSFILGLPYETHKTIKETLNFINKIEIDMIPINIADVYPGTELFDMVENNEGGIRWIPGYRFNWETYERDRCQTEVNDLTEADLLNYYNKALDLVEKKTARRFTI
jgi:radical SAM superfamily enzyme YgiQ (UPF0313 family)